MNHILTEPCGSKSSSKLKELSGTLIVDRRFPQDSLRFLSSEGVYYKISKNKKYRLLKKKVGECIRIVARILTFGVFPLLEVVSFSGEFNHLNLEEEMDNLDSAIEIQRHVFVDYEAYYS